MKRLNIKIAGLALLATAGLMSCSTDFLEEKKNYDYADPSFYNDYAGALARVSDCYRYVLPDPNGAPGFQYTSTGKADDWSKCTEEFSGFGLFVDPTNELNTVSGVKQQPDYFQGSDAANIQNNVWGFIRNINDAIIGIEGSTLSQDQKNALTGQLYFLRAWRYWRLVQWYGGVPIIKDLLPFVSSSVVPRSTTKECIEFIVDDLDKAADLLQDATGAGQWLNGDNYGRVTTGTALAMKGRVLTWWCSPLFNRTGDQERYAAAYATMKADLERINACGYSLYKPEGKGNTIKDWANMFNVMAGSTEGVFIARFNSIAPDGRPDFSRNNPWEHQCRPSNAFGGGGITPSAMIVDLFPMADGKRPASYDSYTNLEASSISYDKDHPFMYRDQRFYRTFGFPGLRWQFSHGQTALPTEDTRYPYVNGSDYELWNYVWYTTADKVNDPNADAYGADGLLKNAKGMYVTKRTTTDNSFAMYQYISPISPSVTDDVKGFRLGYASYMELRYAEVLLNLAEVACGAGDMAYAAEQLRAIRQRAGYNEVASSKGEIPNGINYTNFGLPEAITGDPAVCMSAILYERQIEFAFEGKRFDDMRRWLLFDGGVNFEQIAGAPASWKLTGWGGNTCTYLGFKPFNGQRRGNLEFQVNPAINGGLGSDKWNNFKKKEKQKQEQIQEDGSVIEVEVEVEVEDIAGVPDPIFQYAYAQGLFASKGGSTQWAKFVDWRNDFRFDLDSWHRFNQDKGNKNIDTKLEQLRDNFYIPFLKRKDKKGDALNADQTTDGMVVNYLPRYYFLGLNSNAHSKNPTLEQTIGWEDSQNGGNGTFDPLAE